MKYVKFVKLNYKTMNNREKFKLSVISTEYHINKKKHRVRCKLKVGIKGDPTTIDMLQNFSDYPFVYVTGEANLSPCDTFNVEVGKKIARAKAESLAYARLSRELDRILQKMMGIAEDFAMFKKKANGVCEHNAKFIKEF